MVLQQIADPISCRRPCEFLSGKSFAHPPFSVCAAPSFTIVSKNNTAAKNTEIRVLYVGMRVNKNYSICVHVHGLARREERGGESCVMLCIVYTQLCIVYTQHEHVISTNKKNMA